MDEFKLTIKLFGDSNICVFVISEGDNKKRYKLPTKMFPMEVVPTPEQIGKIMTEYVRKYCT